MSELSVIGSIEREEIEEMEASQQANRRQKQRFEAALAFTVAACDNKGMATDHDIRYAVLQADRLAVYLDKSIDELNEGYGLE